MKAFTAITFSVEEDIKQDMNRLAREQRRSKSDIFREMYDYYMLKRSLSQLQLEGQEVAARLGLETADDVVRYLHET
jgi:predicted transcriptional regulator